MFYWFFHCFSEDHFENDINKTEIDQSFHKPHWSKSKSLEPLYKFEKTIFCSIHYPDFHENCKRRKDKIKYYQGYHQADKPILNKSADRFSFKRYYCKICRY